MLTNNMDGQHSVLIEGDEGAVVEGLWVWTPGGTHGLILKSAHSVVRDYHCKGAVADCLLVKSDYMTAANRNATDDVLEGIHIGWLEKPGDTGGITLDATWDTISNVRFRDVEEDGVWFGFLGAGSWFHRLKGVRVEGWKARGLVGPCTTFGMRTEAVITGGDCQSVWAERPVERRSFRLWCKAMFSEVKPQSRIL